MKLTTTLAPMLAALTPAVVGQVQSLGSLGQITIDSHSDPDVHSIYSTTAPTKCEKSAVGTVNATTIEISQHKVPIKCTFYSEHKCSGQNYTLGAGKHDFKKRPLLVDSFECARNETATSS
ncbi:hypothetical protein ASPVEDRAFT_33457 [Aspergillus versicolor CBS 583.65]|uniref:AA1-like domain-containing protein n=1 Tax=Aspergillus versicolor CBS 583.65 TaxID=1036611 RepID=A0A1L9Q0I9_ASPVE|nr:uncharacterized protein ASPVEDRAFT_33457 [Aspergillus versicolor CBS 583.65]OJJ07226.1 hypothetical protein ASPVEDRAFT_33457 [Aspergillus versicolor CBS 583.65]